MLRGGLIGRQKDSFKNRSQEKADGEGNDGFEEQTREIGYRPVSSLSSRDGPPGQDDALALSLGALEVEPEDVTKRTVGRTVQAMGEGRRGGPAMLTVAGGSGERKQFRRHPPASTSPVVFEVWMRRVMHGVIPITRHGMGLHSRRECFAKVHRRERKREREKKGEEWVGKSVRYIEREKGRGERERKKNKKRELV